MLPPNLQAILGDHLMKPMPAGGPQMNRPALPGAAPVTGAAPSSGPVPPTGAPPMGAGAPPMGAQPQLRRPQPRFAPVGRPSVPAMGQGMRPGFRPAMGTQRPPGTREAY